MHIAWSKAPTILMFSIIAATVGMILEYVVDRIRFIGWILSYILGTLWSLGTLFVIPIIVTDESPSAPRAIKNSVKFFKQTWGENITAKVSVNAPLALLNILLLFVFLTVGFAAATTFGFVAFIVILILYFVIAVTLAVVGSFANSLINIALFYYATYHTVPPAFSEELLNRVFIQHERRFFKKKSKTTPT